MAAAAAQRDAQERLYNIREEGAQQHINMCTHSHTQKDRKRYRGRKFFFLAIRRAMGFGINYKNACLGDINLVLWVRKLMVKNNNKMCGVSCRACV